MNVADATPGVSPNEDHAVLLKCILGLGLAVVTATTALADVPLKDRQQAACYNDVQRLCGEFVPNEEKTGACMSRMKDKVSAGCRKYYTE